MQEEDQDFEVTNDDTILICLPVEGFAPSILVTAHLKCSACGVLCRVAEDGMRLIEAGAKVLCMEDFLKIRDRDKVIAESTPQMTDFGKKLAKAAGFTPEEAIESCVDRFKEIEKNR